MKEKKCIFKTKQMPKVLAKAWIRYLLSMGMYCCMLWFEIWLRNPLGIILVTPFALYQVIDALSIPHKWRCGKIAKVRAVCKDVSNLDFDIMDRHLHFSNAHNAVKNALYRNRTYTIYYDENIFKIIRLLACDEIVSE